MQEQEGSIIQMGLDTYIAEDALLEQAYRLDREASRLQKRAKKMKEERNALIAEAQRKGITSQGSYRLEDKTRASNSIRVDILREKYPDVFAKVAKVAIKDAKLHLSQAQLEECMEHSTEVRTVLTYESQYLGKRDE